ncbi:hypothetical protein [Amphritea pacifica]|uniref:hypothetical protein n=1 Tax=Amphritea pacifica TaxID=2811233 RepID=UPI00196605BB|nr:hypothetical protein [Amphritea pacifica]MBN1006876.1 hypothetical protein [Amphritea pacifica]
MTAKTFSQKPAPNSAFSTPKNALITALPQQSGQSNLRIFLYKSSTAFVRPHGIQPLLSQFSKSDFDIPACKADAIYLRAKPESSHMLRGEKQFYLEEYGSFREYESRGLNR